MRLWSWNMSPLHSHSRLFFPFNFRIYALRNAVLCQLNISIHRGDSAGKKKNQGIHHWHLEWVPGELASLQSYWSSVEAVGLKSCQEGFKQIYVLFFKKQMKQQELAADGMGCTWDWTNVAKLVEFSRDCIIGVEINLQQDAGLLLRTATLRIVCSQSRREQNQKNLMPNSGEKKKDRHFLDVCVIWGTNQGWVICLWAIQLLKFQEMKSWLSTGPSYITCFCLNFEGGLDSQKCMEVSKATTYLPTRSKGTKTTPQLTLF